jgi:hypothetical protein
MGLGIGTTEMGLNGISSWVLAVNDKNFPLYDAQTQNIINSIHKYNFKIKIMSICNPYYAIPNIKLKRNRLYPYIEKHIRLLFDIDLPRTIENENQFETAAIIYIYWTKIIEKLEPELIFRIDKEEDHIKLLNLIKNNDFLNNQEIDIVNLKHKINLFPQNTSSIPEQIINQFKQLPDQLQQDINDFCKKYDYSISE